MVGGPPTGSGPLSPQLASTSEAAAAQPSRNGKRMVPVPSARLCDGERAARTGPRRRLAAGFVLRVDEKGRNRLDAVGDRNRPARAGLGVRIAVSHALEGVVDRGAIAAAELLELE